jgi:hypothetical protein
MSNREDKRDKVWQRYLYAAYGIAAVGIAIAIWAGAFTPNSRFVTDIFPAIILFLAFATVLVSGQASSVPAPGRRAVIDVVKGIACWIIAFVWIAALARRVPNTPGGAALLVAPAFGVGLWGMFYVGRAYLSLTGRVKRSLLTPQTIVDLGPSEGSKNAVFAGDLSQRIEIAVDYGAVIFRLALALFLYTAAWWLLGRDSALVSTIFAVATVYLIYLNCRIVFGHGPGLILSPSGIFLRQGLGLVSDLAWSEATTVEIKATKIYYCIVIGMRNADRLIEGAGGYRRWALRSNWQRFGSPFLIFASSLKCDRKWLFQTITAYRLRYGTP